MPKVAHGSLMSSGFPALRSLLSPCCQQDSGFPGLYLCFILSSLLSSLVLCGVKGATVNGEVGWVWRGLRRFLLILQWSWKGVTIYIYIPTVEVRKWDATDWIVSLPKCIKWSLASLVWLYLETEPLKRQWKLNEITKHSPNQTWLML